MYINVITPPKKYYFCFNLPYMHCTGLDYPMCAVATQTLRYKMTRGNVNVAATDYHYVHQ